VVFLVRGSYAKANRPNLPHEYRSRREAVCLTSDRIALARRFGSPSYMQKDRLCLFAISTRVLFKLRMVSEHFK